MDIYRIINLAAAIIFGHLGMVAMLGIVFAEAQHQWIFALICGLISVVCIVEVRQEKTKK
ncbi:hypothetical protein LJB87_00930 [Alistipes sp. OttesenSCG-928-L06]|nr:hypothetical protein [Alistipes sp. OttesenSCG-928-L06]